MEESNKELLRVSAFSLLVLTLILVGFITFSGYKNTSVEYRNTAKNTYQKLVDTALINKVILESFASIADEINEFPYHETLSRYTEQVKRNYPHIYMLELQQKVSSDKLSSFEQLFKKAGYHYFSVKSFSYESSRDWQLVEQKDEYYPVTFMAPFNPEAREILGLDISSVPFLSRALLEAVNSNEVVASKPFELAEGGRAYVLFKKLKKNSDVVASILINTNELLRYVEREQVKGQLTLKYPDYQGNWLDESINQDQIQSSILGSYQFDYNFESLGQPFSLAVSFPVQLSDFNLFRALFICIISLLIFLVLKRLQLTSAKLKNELEQSNRTLKSTIKQKERLFANISHELRTPLTLISAPLDNLSEDKNLTIGQQNMVKLAKSNSERLYSLASRIIELSSVDTKPQQIESIAVDDLVIRLKIAFEPLLKAKNISFNCSFNAQAVMEADVTDLTSVLENLLTNALKYTVETGQVDLITKVEVDNLIVEVKNSHKGLSEQEVASMFDRFERLNVSDSQKGFGLGLALVKEICTANNWQIECVSEIGFVQFKLIIDRLKILDDVITPSERQLNVLTRTSSTTKQNRKTLLIVEDNQELREFLVSLLSTTYNVIGAADGKEGVNLATEYVPDLIISDLMMPELSGYDLVEQLSAQDSTSHIPVILLTAKTEKQSELKGLEFGAVDYITKPFVAKELMYKIDNIISRRQTIAVGNTFEHNNETKQDSPVLFSERDKAFFERLQRILSNEYSNCDFNVEVLVSQVALSERQLQRKLKALYNQTPAEHIRQYRINKAKELLKNGKPVAIVASEVGFNSASYFSTSFKTVVGCTPKQYLQS